MSSRWVASRPTLASTPQPSPQGCSGRGEYVPRRCPAPGLPAKRAGSHRRALQSTARTPACPRRRPRRTPCPPPSPPRDTPSLGAAARCLAARALRGPCPLRRTVGSPPPRRLSRPPPPPRARRRRFPRVRGRSGPIVARTQGACRRRRGSKPPPAPRGLPPL
eukprot:scaffold43391_cov65-Phaeocystis_antarctica.AAC.5